MLNHLRSGGRLSNHKLLQVEGPAQLSPIPQAQEGEDGDVAPPSEKGSDMEGDSHSDGSSSDNAPNSEGTRDSISVISDLEDDGCWVDEFLINMQSRKYHRTADIVLPTANMCVISSEEHAERHASRRIADLCTQQNIAREAVVKSLFVSDNSGKIIDFFSGETDWASVNFPITASFIPIVSLCHYAIGKSTALLLSWPRNFEASF